MQKEINFKIIELDECQVLFSKDFEDSEDDDEETSYLLVVTFFLDGVKVQQKMGYSSEETRDKNFDNSSEEIAQTMVNSVLDMLN